MALTELRLAVEPAAARLTALRATEETRAEMGRLAQVLQTLGNAGKGDTEEYLAADIAFHNLLLEACGNLMLTALREPVAEMLSGRHNAGLTPRSPWRNHSTTTSRPPTRSSGVTPRPPRSSCGPTANRS
ncbi:FCD domain-containing protein [Nesterenkonia pannonica]|uniref:FCD domain-containing protein n=1 Tax=Nesterenkonia pannonica TaxID=1548602 RepID=UPI0021640F4D|nr:FCD domain-containing protein [Nesterenkonia pannonica]